jgi:hypothetical protein
MGNAFSNQPGAGTKRVRGSSLLNFRKLPARQKKAGSLKSESGK